MQSEIGSIAPGMEADIIRWMRSAKGHHGVRRVVFVMKAGRFTRMRRGGSRALTKIFNVILSGCTREQPRLRRVEDL